MFSRVNLALWRMCVGWDRGSEIIISGDGSWCVMLSGNRYTRWFPGETA